MSGCPYSNKNSISKKESTENTESTLNNWGCQIIKEGGLEFYIKTNKLLKCRFTSDDKPTVCPFKPENKQPIQNITAPPTSEPTPTSEDKDSEDKEGYLTVPINNMPPFLTLKETKDILQALDMKFKVKTDNWNNIHFYYSLGSQNPINENIQLQDIIKEIKQIIYLK